MLNSFNQIKNKSHNKVVVEIDNIIDEVIHKYSIFSGALAIFSVVNTAI